MVFLVVKIRTSHSVVVAIGLSYALLGGGCASKAWDGPEAVGSATRAPTSALVFESPMVLQGQRASGELAFDRFEFGRNDRAVNATRQVPLLATNTWPQPPKPVERRIRFSDWQQR